MDSRHEKNDAEIVEGNAKTTPDQMIAYLLYALQEVRVMSQRSAGQLASAIAALAEDTQREYLGEIRETIARDLWLN
jgi:hypothetical protein